MPIVKHDLFNNNELHQAVSEGNLDTVRKLLGDGFDITLRNIAPFNFNGQYRLGKNALDITLEKKQPNSIIIMLLLLHAAAYLPAAKQKEFLQRVKEDKSYPNVFMYIAECHSPEVLKEAVALVALVKKQGRGQGPDLSVLGTKNDQGETILMKAASFGLVGTVRELIDLNARLLVDVDSQHNTALHKAAIKGHAEVVRLLSNIDPESMTKTNADGETPFHLAVQSGNPEVVKVFLEKDANLGLRNEHMEEENALDIANRVGNEEIMKQLLCKAISLSPDQQKSCLSNIDGGMYDNVLIYAMSEHPDCVPDLMEVKGKKVQYLAAKDKMDEFFAMDVHIKPLRNKLKEMEGKEKANEHYSPAIRAAKVLIRDLEMARSEFLDAAPANSALRAQLKEKCLAAINAARPELEKHRELGKYYVSLAAVIVTFPISLPLMALGVFSLKTDSEQKLNQLKKSVDDLAPSAEGAAPEDDAEEDTGVQPQQ